MVRNKTRGTSATPHKDPGGTQKGTLDTFLSTPAPTSPLPPIHKMAAASTQAGNASDETPGLQRVEALISSLPTRADIDRLITSVQDTFKAELAVVHTELAEVGSRVTRVERRLDKVSAAGEAGQLPDFRRRLDDLENRSRRQNIRIRGVSEEVTDIPSYLLGLFNSILETDKITRLHIDRAHRVFRPRPQTPSSPPRDIICHITDFLLKEEVLNTARNASPWRYLDMDVELYQDLSAFTLAARRALRPVTSSLREAGIPYRWGHPFALVVRRGPILHALNYYSDVPDFLAALDIPPLEIEDWEKPVLARGAARRAGPRQNLPRPQNTRVLHHHAIHPFLLPHVGRRRLIAAVLLQVLDPPLAQFGTFVFCLDRFHSLYRKKRE
uniref:Uncharacterized protein n=1 Tax=Leptobrachium leishanense TaxID=445787 RepID=A0A8C5LV70_9ANUR